MNKILSYTFLIVVFGVVYSIISSGCAQIGSPTGGPKDTIPPHLINAVPKMGTVNYSGTKIVLTFDEYVNVDNAITNVIVSPYPKKNPGVDFKLRTITLKLKDTLLANTTYSINFGNSIKDVNEGNVVKNFTYVFSTGDTIDSMEVKGKVLLAESGKVDSTLMIYLYRNANDSSVQQKRPDYVTNVNGDGFFIFKNLPVDNFRIYAIKDEDGSKTYNSKFEEFAFSDSDINTATSVSKVRLFAYSQEKEDKKQVANPSTIGKTKKKTNIKFRYTTSASAGNQDLLGPFEIAFTKELKDVDSQKIILTDTFYHPIKSVLTVDSTRKSIFIQPEWTEATDYRLIIDTSAVSDSTDEHLARTDTIKFKTKKQSDYGSLLLHFTNIAYNRNPVLLLLKGETIIRSIPITSSEWSDKTFPPGEYQLRILYDDNNNGKWDTGNYLQKRQPEKVFTLDKKLTIKADWDNERDIEL